MKLNVKYQHRKMSLKRNNSNGETPFRKKSRQSIIQESEEDEDMDLSQQVDLSNLDSGEADAGIIEKVTLRNFMCHAGLEMNMGANVNFIIGKNGSGKSSVMTGVVLGLGGKATATNRANSVKTFIKTGRSSADIIIKLRNRGPDAYKHDVYGDSIIIERRICKEAHGYYKVKNAMGKLVSNKREELTRVVDHLNIQVDNPIAILNQDTSRNFLNSKSPKDKYKFFLKATQLEQMKYDYTLAVESENVARDTLSSKQETLPELQKEVEEWETKFKSFEALDKLRDKVQELKNEIVWAHVTEAERALEPIAKELRTEEARTPKFVQKVKDQSAKMDKLTHRHKQIQEEVKALSEEATTLEPQHTEAKALRDSRKKIVKDLEMQVRRCVNDINASTKDKDQILQRIEELRNSVKPANEDETRIREERIVELSQKLEELKAKQRTTEHAVEQFQSAANQARQEQYKCREEEQQLRDTATKLRGKIKNMESAKTNNLLRFGQWMPEVHRRIEESFNRGKFHQKPRGPLGASLSLKDPKWATGVETCLKSLVHAFCCHDHHDERELEKIFRETCPPGKKPSTIVSQFQKQIYNVSNHKARSEHPSVLDMLQIDDPVVVNTLIDQRGIETVVLIQDQEEATQIMLKNPPRNCREAFTMDGAQLFCLPTFRFYAGSGRESRLLSANIEDNINRYKEEMNKQNADLQRVRTKANTLNREVTDNQNQERRSQTQLNKIRSMSGAIAMEISELKNIEEPEPINVAALEEEVSSYEVTIQKESEKKRQLEMELGDAKTTYVEAENNFKHVDQRIRAIAEKKDPVRDEMAHVENDIQKVKDHKKYYEQKLKDHEAKIAELNKKSDTQKAKVQDDIQKAEQFCPRIRTRRTVQNLKSEIEQINIRITAEEKNRGNKDEITKKYHDTLAVYKKIVKEVSQLNNFLKNLADMMKRRQQAYVQFRKMIALRAKYFFIMLLTHRHYLGKIEFDHPNEMLHLSVQPTITRDGEGAKDMKSLSGGERSFATVCFILALWDSMESPFRMLDEFDVFMDMVNRRMAMEMMLVSAQARKSNQFIFLSPQDMSHLNVDHHRMKIFEMHPPVRGQQTISFERKRARRDDDDDDDES